MALAHTVSASVLGVDAFPIRVEIDLSFGLPGFQVVGLPDGAVKEARDRVRSSLRNSGFEPYQHKITANLAPADLRKEGSGFDLPIALAMLCAQGVIEQAATEDLLVVGELGLDGALRPIPGALPIALLAREMNCRALLVPADNASEAAVVDEISVIPVTSLKEAVEWINGERDVPAAVADEAAVAPEPDPYEPDFAEVRGQENVKRAMEVAAAGGHNLLMIGPPGSGKTMLAKRLATILPTPTFDESLETTKIYSVASLLPSGTALMPNRPFRSPHHSISDAGLIGGGTIPKPGEVSLSHNGVLFLDELPEFKKHVLEVMRQPLEDGYVTISRAAMRITYPARLMLVASMNPCPCGYYGDKSHPCSCTPIAIKRYQNKLSGPLLDRIDIHVDVPAIKYREMSDKRKGESSAEIRQRVERARTVQKQRFSGRRGVHANAQMGPSDIEQWCALTNDGHRLMEQVVDQLGMSARATTRILKVARTIADLDGHTDISIANLSEAVQYRSLDRQGP